MVVHANDPNTWEVGQKFKVLLSYIVSLKSACDIKDLISKKKSLVLYGGHGTMFGTGSLSFHPPYGFQGLNSIY